MNAALSTQTYGPGASADLADVHSFLAAHADRRGARPKERFLLVGAEEGEHVELPEPLYRVLVQVVEAMAAGKAVTITPQEPRLTTQQSADLLGVSRPTVVRLIDSGDLRAERHGNRRRLLLSDVLAYREQRRQRQYAMLDATALDIEEEDDPQDVIERLREARRIIAANHD